MRRFAVATGCALLALGLPTAVLGQANQSWAQAEIKLVTGRGLLGGNAATFKPDAPLTRRALVGLVAGLTDMPPPRPGPTTRSR
jgi:S-layer homology domain